jgi:hypothetical protein
LNFGTAPTVIYYHIPRTGGSTFWHSLVDSFKDKELEILDTYAMSFESYGNDLHEQEFLNEIVSTLTLIPRIIHVHTSLDFSDLPENSLIVYGIRSNWSWRKSWISHQIKKIFADSSNSTKQKEFQYKFVKRVKNKLKFVYELLTDDIYFFYKNPTLRYAYRPTISHNLNDESMLQTLEILNTYLKMDQEKLRIKRYQNLEISNLRRHDLEGFFPNMVGTVITFLTYPIYLILSNVRKIILKITGKEIFISKDHETPQGETDIDKKEHDLRGQYSKDFLLQNVLKNPDFENCSNETLVVNKDGTYCADNWYLNRGGKIIFRQFSHSLDSFSPKEPDTFVEIENCDPANTFFEIVQEIDLVESPLKLEGERCIFSFELRHLKNQSMGQRTSAMIYYSLSGSNHHRLINTVHEIKSELGETHSIWRQYNFVSKIPHSAKKVFIGVLVDSKEGIDDSFSLHLKNVHFGLRASKKVS